LGGLAKTPIYLKYMVRHFKTLYEKIMMKEIRKKIDDPERLCPFDNADILIYLLIAGIWGTLLLIAFYYA
jgi:hypothetical protein